MSNGRVELGLGAGWFEQEHAAYGIPFPPLGERFDRLEEQLAIVSGLWGTAEGERFDFAGRHYQLTDSPGLPKPLQRPGPPIIVGGHGKKRTPALAARYAAEFNCAFSPVDEVAEMFDLVRAACDRDRSNRRRSCCRPRRRCAAGGPTPRSLGGPRRSAGPVEKLRADGLCGTPEEIAARIREFAKVGAERMFLQVLDIDDLDHLDVISSVLPLLVD